MTCHAKCLVSSDYINHLAIIGKVGGFLETHPNSISDCFIEWIRKTSSGFIKIFNNLKKEKNAYYKAIMSSRDS